MSTADKSQKTSARGSERHKIEKTPTKGDSRCRKSGGIRLPEIVNRTCIAGTTWTLADEAADLNREVEALAAGGSFAMDAHGGMFLQFLGMDGQRVFIAHLMAGHLRQAISMVATGAFECGMAEGRRQLGSQPRQHGHLR